MVPGEPSRSICSPKVSCASCGGGDVRGDDGGLASSAVAAAGRGEDDEHSERGDEGVTSASCAGALGSS